MDVANVPSWCPAWVRREVGDYPYMIGERLETIIRSPSTAKIWEAMGKRAAHWYRDYPEFDKSNIRLLWPIQGVIEVGLQFGREYRLTKRQRQAIGRTVSRGSNTLAEAFDQIYDAETGQLPVAFETRLAILATELTTQHREALRGLKPDGALELNADVASIQEEAIRFAIRRVPTLLQRLAVAAESFAGTPAFISRPGDENASRLFFIRFLTHSFVDGFGSPMREHVLAITSVFFDCDTLTAADISALAPMPKTDE
jgi:hypothetical protein